MDVMELFRANGNAKHFHTHWNECSPLALFLLEATCGVTEVMELFRTNGNAKHFHTHWNECSPLALLLLEATCRVMEFPSANHGARFLLPH
jgi:hypothetical protein